MTNKPGAATPAADLRKRITDPNVPKSEAEWWAYHRIAELEQQVARQQWQPIETAPKDGTAILVSAFHDNGLGEIYEEGGAPDVVRWVPTTRVADDGAEINWVTRNTRLRSNKSFSPTHWMPLPEPPLKGNPDA